VVAGDVITFMRGTSDVPVTHRVIGVVETGDGLAFETMGDANEGPDPGLVPAANLIGVVTLTIPYIGYVVQFAGTQAGFVALVLIPFGLLAATEVLSIVRGRDESGSAAEAVDIADVDPDTETASVDASTAQSNGETAATGSGGVSVDTVGGAAAVLVGVAPYAAYVAVELRTAASIAVAIGATTLLVGALAVWIPASGVLDRNAPTGDSRTESAAASAPLPDEAAAPADGAGEGD
jgi:signal peptidase